MSFGVAPATITVLGIEVNTWVAEDGVIVYYANPDQTRLRRASGVIALGAAISTAMLVGQTAIAAEVEEME